MAIITIKINHNTDRGKYLINQVHRITAQKEIVKLLYETFDDSESLINDYIKNSEEMFLDDEQRKENQKKYMESVYGENIKNENDIILNIYRL